MGSGRHLSALGNGIPRGRDIGMNEWPEVAILIITYRRLALATEQIRSIKEFLDYPNLSWHIADDGHYWKDEE